MCSIEACNRPHYCRSWCRRHYERWKTHGDPLTVHRLVTESLEDRLLHYSERAASGCLLWTGATSANGYGVMTTSGRARSVHRVAHEVWIGDVPADEVVRHRCDVKACIEPAHLITGSQSDNIADQIERRRHTVQVNGRGLVSDAELRRMLAMRAAGLTYQRIANDLGRAIETVHRHVQANAA